jgi:sugar-phosphatase
VIPAALLLDLDGTLVDSEPLHQASYRSFFEARGWEPPDLSVFTGRRAEDVFAVLPGPWTGHDYDALADEVTAFVADSGPPEPLPGAAELIAAAHRHGVPVAVVTSAGPAWTTRAIEGPLDAAERIDLLVTSADVVDGKPDPTGYRLACERLGVDAARALAAEDSPAGVRAAVAAGVGEVVAVSTTHAEAELVEAGAARVVRDLSSLLARFGA